MRKLLILLMLLINLTSQATTYYVSTSGSDLNAGTNINLPIATIAKVNSLSLVAGDFVLFKCGDTWLNQGYLYVGNGNSSSQITYSSYGNGNKPILKSLSPIIGWNNTSNWTQSGNAWYISSNYNANRLLVDGVEYLKKQSLPLNSTNKWYCTASLIYVYSATNPATTFSSMECPINAAYVIYGIARNYITISGIDIQGGGSSIRAKGCSNWIVENCNIGLYNGGNGIATTTETANPNNNNWTVRNNTFNTGCNGAWGWEAKYTSDAIQMSGGCHDWNIYGNTFNDWGHNCLAFVNTTSEFYCSNIKFHNNYCSASHIDYGRAFGLNSANLTSTGNEIYDNIFYDMGSMEEINAPYLKVYRNIFFKSREPAFRTLTAIGVDLDGYSVGKPQNCEIYNNVFAYLDNQAIRFSITGNARKNNKIVNNIFYECDLKGTRNTFEISQSDSNYNNTFENNLFFKTGVSKLITYFSGIYTTAEFNALNGTDGNVISNNIQGNPLFVDPINGNFKLQDGSPAINTGKNVGLTVDVDGNEIIGNPDLGVYETPHLKTYYVSIDGNDSNDGTTEFTPWQTLSKVNSSTFSPGDKILFRRGDTFYGSLTIDDSGTSGNPITFGAYGTGPNPIITGFTSVNAWTNLGSNIWESTSAVSTLNTCNMVTVNSINTPMGRYPNSGFATFQSHTSTSITSSSLTGTPSWVGATLAVKFNSYTINRKTITSQSGGTLNWSGSLTYSNESDFIIQNDIKTLDQQNEWYYNPSTKKLTIYSTNQPVNVKVATVDYLVEYAKESYNYSKCRYVDIENLTFQGSNDNAIQSYQSLVAGHTLYGTNISNCEISFAGMNGIRLISDTLSIENCIIKETSGSAINTTYSGVNNIKNNTISNISLTAGSGGEYSDTAILSSSISSGNFQGNSILNTGFNGISFDGTGIITVRNNIIQEFCHKANDGGAITSGGVKAAGTRITRNICLGENVVGNIVGIYLDDDSNNTEVDNNTIANCYWAGIYLHNASSNNIHHNISYNNGIQFRTGDDNLGGDVTNNNIQYNQFIAKTSTQYCAEFSSNQNNIPTIGILANNYYARTINDGKVFNINQPSIGVETKTLAEWQAFSGQDANSKKSPKSITSINDLAFVYNETNAAKSVTLPFQSIDIAGKKIATIQTLQPYTSLVVIQDLNNPSNYKKTILSQSGKPLLDLNGFPLVMP